MGMRPTLRATASRAPRYCAAEAGRVRAPEPPFARGVQAGAGGRCVRAFAIATMVAAASTTLGSASPANADELWKQTPRFRRGPAFDDAAHDFFRAPGEAGRRRADIISDYGF